MSQNKDFPIGYLRCLKCGRPALWLILDTTHTPIDKEMISLGIQYELININYIYDPDIAMCYFCDSCYKEVSEDNLDSQYIVLINNSDLKVKQ